MLACLIAGDINFLISCIICCLLCFLHCKVTIFLSNYKYLVVKYFKTMRISSFLSYFHPKFLTSIDSFLSPTIITGCYLSNSDFLLSTLSSRFIN